jgi:hypothetical protein
MGFKGIDTEEATVAKQLIMDQSSIAKDAIKQVKESPTRLPSWKGNLKQRFEESVQEDMRKLDQATVLIDEAAERIRTAIERFSAADE